MTGPRAFPTQTEILGIPLPSDMNAYVRAWMVVIEHEAVAAGEAVRREYPNTAELRSKAVEYEARGLRWLASANIEIADLLDRGTIFAGAAAVYKAATGAKRLFAHEFSLLIERHYAERPERAEAAE